MQALAAYAILDTLPEKEYDDIAQLASEICDTPVGLVTVIEKDRQWFKAHYGTDYEETPRDLAFCIHNMEKQGQVMVVNDLRNDDRFKDNPLVNDDPHVIFYAGVPLVDADGFALGSLCVIDHEPKKLSDNQVRALKTLGHLVIQLLELRKSKLELQRTYDVLERRNQELDQYAYVASHDLQEPLRTIHDFSEILEEEAAPEMNDEHRRFLGYIRSSAHRMRLMIQHLLRHSRLGRELVLEPVDLNEVIKDLREDLTSLFTDNEASLLVGPLPVIVASRNYAQEILQNLLTNAIKYRRPEVAPVIEITAHELPDMWEIAVADNGIGMEEKHFSRVFELFQRLHTHDNIEGTGIGLAQCKKIVELYGGRIWLESTLGQGTTVRFTLSK